MKLVITQNGPLVLLVALTWACAPPHSPAEQDARIHPEYSPSGRLTRLTYDRDADGAVDTWAFMDGSRVLRIEVDENADGKVDRWEYYAGAVVPGAVDEAPARGAAAPRADRTIERMERATRHDGKIDRREFFEGGVLTRVEEDTNGDGGIDKWEIYTAGTLSTLALDTKGRGVPDRRLIYTADGSFSRIEVDLTGSGVFQPLKP